MTDLTDALEAAARAFTDAHNNAVDRDYEYGIPFVSDDDQTAAIAGMQAAAPIIEASVRAKIAEAIEAQYGIYAGGINDGFAEAAAIARQHAQRPAESAPAAISAPPESDRTSESAETLSGGQAATKPCGCVGKCPPMFKPCPECGGEVTAVGVDDALATTYHPCRHVVPDEVKP